MFKRSFRSQDQKRVGKSVRLKKAGSVRDATKLSRLQRSLSGHDALVPQPVAPSSVVTLTVGRDRRLFAAHEDVLRQSPVFDAACRGSVPDSQSRRIFLPDEEPGVLSAVLEYLYKGDYYPRLLHDRHRDSWHLEDCAWGPQASPGSQSGGGRAAVSSGATVYLLSVGADVLRDTVIYCAADRYGLDELKRRNGRTRISGEATDGLARYSSGPHRFLVSIRQ